MKMRDYTFIGIIALSLTVGAPLFSQIFIPTKTELLPFIEDPSVIMVASTGRSGSSLLTDTIDLFFPNEIVLKSHLLPPTHDFKGKIVFIFSNPDISAESALHITLYNDDFGWRHFLHMESSDHKWLDAIGSTTNQTIASNLLAYDALGCLEQLKRWLFVDTKECEREEATILALKYENLWDSETLEQLRLFLGNSNFMIPKKRPRGLSRDQQTELEIEIIDTYNKGTSLYPKYSAYDGARALWEQAPPYNYLKVK